MHIEPFPNNQPVADFFCTICNSQYELKSKKGELGDRINDGAFHTMNERILSNTNPDFFFLSYSQKDNIVKSFVIVPKHFFVPEIIEKRKPLSVTARRSGWIGCNILLSAIPRQGWIYIINNGKINNKQYVVEQLNKSKKLETMDIKNRGWLLDVLNCVNNINTPIFNTDDIYKFEHLLSHKHPDNNNVRAKIRQQLQFLRDKGYIEFLVPGQYRKL